MGRTPRSVARDFSFLLQETYVLHIWEKGQWEEVKNEAGSCVAEEVITFSREQKGKDRGPRAESRKGIRWLLSAGRMDVQEGCPLALAGWVEGSGFEKDFGTF